jgi:hypothetical protein
VDTPVNDNASMKTAAGLYFGGQTGYVDVPGFQWGTNKNAITVEFWTKVNSTTDVGNRSLFSIGNNNSHRLQAHVPWGDNVLYWDYGPFGQRITADFSCYLDKWTHVALVSEGNSGNFQAIYLN